MPLHVNGKPFGVLAVYADYAPREFTVDDVTFAETVAHLLGRFGRAHQGRRETPGGTRGQIEPAGHGRFDGHDARHGRPRRQHEPRCEELTQFQIDDVRDQPFWQAMVAPDDADL